ncbi:MAG: GxxExxY protein [bacterium]
MKDQDLTGRVIGCFFIVYNELGFGLPESVYSSALEILFREEGIVASREHRIDVFFRGKKIGWFRADWLIEERLILELKVGHRLPPGSKDQLITNLRMSKKDLGLLLYFGPVPEIQRVAL